MHISRAIRIIVAAQYGVITFEVGSFRIVKLHLGPQRKCKVRLHGLEGGRDGFFRDPMVRDVKEANVDACVPYLPCESLLNVRVWIADTLQVYDWYL